MSDDTKDPREGVLEERAAQLLRVRVEAGR